MERDEKQISLIARDVDANHQELGARLQVTAQQIRSEVHAAKSTLYSEITQTATQIRSEVTDSVAGLSSSITQNADKIALVVTSSGGTNKIDVASIVAGINGQSGSYVMIQANKIDLSGYVTTSMMSSAFQDIQQATIKQLTIPSSNGYFTFKNYNVSWKSQSVITGVTRSNSRYFMYAKNGDVGNPDTILGSLVTDISSTTIYYMGR